MGIYRSRVGDAYPPGATLLADGVNFSIFSRHATKVWLALFENDASRRPLEIFELDPNQNRTFFFWHVFVENVRPGMQYTWRLDGPAGNAKNGFRFNAKRQLLDPWARAVSTTHWDRRQASESGASDVAIRAIVEADEYDWEGDQPLGHRLEDSIIYELHVRGFTRHPSASVTAPGTFRGLSEKIPYLKSLGITEVELMPIAAFDPNDLPQAPAARGLSNYWGYSPYAFFALHPAYAAEQDVIREFRDLVKALHRADIGVILDVVLNHTAEGNELGPVINLKGFANEVYYHLDPRDRRRYRDYTGCGNSINANHPVVTQLLQQCVEYWVREMHVDGFRFDLASELTRGEDGATLDHAPVIWNIELSPQLADTYLIAEAWDATGVNQLGNFPGFRWAEWNCDYRDVVRRFLRGDAGMLAALASRIAGSSDLFADGGGLPINTINYVTCHDGFTLIDLLSYECKRNEVNGQQNRDGSDANFSRNWGIEGPTDDESINGLRRQQAKNHLAVLMLSQGVPMLLAGDEILRTQQGNNNAYCQDNELSWLDWTLGNENADMLRFTRELIALRQRHPSLRRKRFLTGQPDPQLHGLPDISWHGAALEAPEWSDDAAHVLAFTLAPIVADEAVLHVVLNSQDEAADRLLPELQGFIWYLALDTARPSPGDIVTLGKQRRVTGATHEIQAYSVVVFEGRPELA